LVILLVFVVVFAAWLALRSDGHPSATDIAADTTTLLPIEITKDTQLPSPVLVAPESAIPAQQRRREMWDVLTSNASESAAFESAWAAYAERYHRAAAGDEYDASLPCVVHEDQPWGFGNRAPAQAGALALALVSGRFMFIANEDHTFRHELFEKPDSIEFALVRAPAKVAHRCRVLYESGHCLRITQRILLEADLQRDTYYTKHECWRVPLAAFTARLLASSPHPDVSATYTRMFGTRGFYRLSRKLFVPRERLRDAVWSFYDDRLSNRAVVIGLQIRWAKLKWSLAQEQPEPSGSNWVYIDEFFRLGILMGLEQLSRLGDVRRNIGSTDAARAGEVAIFLATDMPSVRQRALHFFRRYPGVDLVFRSSNPNGCNKLHSADDCIQGGENDFDSLIDLLLLSLSDDLVISASSSFGWVAQGWRGEPAVHLFPRDKRLRWSYIQSPVDYIRPITTDPYAWGADEHYGDFKSRPDFVQDAQMHETKLTSNRLYLSLWLDPYYYLSLLLSFILALVLLQRTELYRRLCDTHAGSARVLAAPLRLGHSLDAQRA